MSREGLLGWGYDYLGDSRLVDMAVKRLRDKLRDDSRNPQYISMVRAPVTASLLAEEPPPRGSHGGVDADGRREDGNKPPGSAGARFLAQ